MTVATFFTCLRIALIPVFGALWATGRHGDALAIFVIAALSDLLDGLLARWLDQKSRLGAILDPAADKLMLLTSFLVAASVGAVPWWLAAVVIGRDVILTGGAALLALALRPRFDAGRIQPTRIGKYATMFQLATIGCALLTQATHATAPRPWVAALVYVTCAFTLVAGAQYLATAARLLAGSAPRPVPLVPLAGGEVRDPRRLA